MAARALLQRPRPPGGFVLRGRICGSLAVARALGDHSFKSATIPQPAQMVSPEPDICYVDRNHQLDEFLVIACDGVFDVMSNEAVADVVRESMRHFNSLTVVASQLVEQALQVILAPPQSPQSHQFPVHFTPQNRAIAPSPFLAAPHTVRLPLVVAEPVCSAAVRPISL